MEEIVTIVFLLLFLGGAILLRYLGKRSDRKAMEQWDTDDLLSDPETGVKLTLEQAETGHWIEHDNEYLTIPESEIQQLDSEEDQIVQRALNYLRKSRAYRKTEFSEDEVQTILESEILGRYRSFTYQYPFRFDKGIVFLAHPDIGNHHDGSYYLRQFTFWIKITDIQGHYFIREKGWNEKVLDFISNDDEIKLGDYECFVFRRSENQVLLHHLLEKLEGKEKLDFELKDDNLFVKTVLLANLEDLIRIEKLLQAF